jgi:ferric enterobactin receptor
MKKLYTIAGLLIAFGTLVAQGPPPGGGPGVGPGNVPGGRDGSPAAEGHLFGKLVDAAGKGIGNASILILQSRPDQATGKQKDILLKGINTQNNGDFSAEDLPANGPLKISISAVGYKPVTQIISFGPPSFEKDMGKIQLVADAKELQEVTVTAAKPTMSLDMDKKVFNVSKDIVSAGGTGIDVLKNVPSINVDIDGNVTLRGSSPQLMVDGKPTTLTLDEIPSDAIESIEVITNPSARYDASGGGAGILNIVLKKNRKTGYNGSVRAGVDSHGQSSLGAGLNFRENKINVSADVNARTIRDWTTGSTLRTNLSDTPQTSINQQELDTTKGYIVFERVGLDYFITNRTTLSFTGFAMQHGANSTSNLSINTDSLYNTGKVPQYSQEEIAGSHSFNGRGATLGIKHLFARQKEEWTADGSFFSGNATNNSLYTTNNFASASGSAFSGSTLQKIQGSGNDRNIILQTDFTDPLGRGTTLETGARAALQSRLNINNNYTYDPDSAAYLLVPSAASNYKSKNDVYAAYATISSSIKDFTYKVGLRAESSSYHGTLLNSGQTFANQYPISLFPSVFISEKLKGNQELQLSYTRRVNRPNFFQLIPFTDSSNKLNITKGNPALVPEFTQSMELTWLKTFPGNNTLLGSVYYKHTDHLITNYMEEETDSATGNTALINTFINANSSYSVGAEITAQNSITNWWDISTNVNVYQSKINDGIVATAPQQALWSWFGKVNTNLKLPSGFTLQVSGMYQSKTNIPVNNNQNQPGPPNTQAQNASQGYIRPFYEVDLGLKKSLMKNKMSLSLSFNDIFKSRRQDQYSYSQYFVQDYSRIRDPQLLRLNFMYSFGKVDASLFKRKNNNVGSAEE